MRWVALLLLLANVGYFAWQYNATLEGAAHGARQAPPLPPDAPSVTLLSELDELPPLRAPAVPDEPIARAAESTVDAGPSSDAGAARERVLPAPYDLPAEGPPPPPVPPPRDHRAASFNVPSNVCLTVGPFAQKSDYVKLADWLQAYATRVEPLIRTLPEQRLFGVYLEPRSQAEAEANLEDLKRKGVRDYLLVRREGLEHAISLGVFSSQDAVNRRLAELNEQGYQPIVVPRTEATEVYFLGVQLAQGHEEPPVLPSELLGAASAEPVDCTNLTKLLSP